MCGSDLDEGFDRRAILERTNEGAVKDATTRDYRRRGFIGRALTALGSIFATTVEISNIARAQTPPHAEKAKQAAQEYASEEAVRTAVSSHASDLVKALTREGHVEDQSLSSLPLGTIHDTIESYVDSDGGVLISARAPNGTPTVKIQVKEQLSGNKELLLAINPETGANRAMIRDLSSSGQSTVLTTADDLDEGVTVQDCTYCDTQTECSRSCGPYSCGCEKVEAQVCYDEPSCDGCFTVDYSCCGDYDCNL